MGHRGHGHPGLGLQVVQAQPQQGRSLLLEAVQGQFQHAVGALGAGGEHLPQVAVEVLGEGEAGVKTGVQAGEPPTGHQRLQDGQPAQRPHQGGRPMAFGDGPVRTDELPRQEGLEGRHHPAGVRSQEGGAPPAPARGAAPQGGFHEKVDPVPIGGQPLHLEVQPALVVRPEDHLPFRHGVEFPEAEGQQGVDAHIPVVPAPPEQAPHGHARELHAPGVGRQDHLGGPGPLPGLPGRLQARLQGGGFAGLQDAARGPGKAPEGKGEAMEGVGQEKGPRGPGQDRQAPDGKKEEEGPKQAQPEQSQERQGGAQREEGCGADAVLDPVHSINLSCKYPLRKGHRKGTII